MILCVSKINVNKAWIQAKIHAEPASQKSFANQWCRMPTWHGEWRHREISYTNQSHFRNFLGNIGDGHLGTFAKIGWVDTEWPLLGLGLTVVLALALARLKMGLVLKPQHSVNNK